MTYPVTQALGQFIAGIHDAEIPAKAVQNARIGFTDSMAVMLAARREVAPQILHHAFAPPTGSSTLYLRGVTAPAPEAALINGCAAHVLDFDDVGIVGHPSTVLVPAIFAEAQHLGLSGTDMVHAYVAGFETWAELALRVHAPLYPKGWHPTGVWGPVAAAAACAALRRLDADRAALAIAIAASMSGGLMVNFCTMTKAYQAGHAARAGVVAARLAQEGFTAAGNALEHPQGLMAAVAPDGVVDHAPSMLGARWMLAERGLSIKKYPMCYCAHRLIDSLLALRQTHCIDADEIERVDVTISDHFAAILSNHAPKTGMAAKFSAEFAMASAAIRGRVSFAELTDSFVEQPEVQALMARVQVLETRDYDPAQPFQAKVDRVAVTLRTGAVIEGPPVQHAIGHASVPLSRRALFEKFESCLEHGGADDIIAIDLFDALMSLGAAPARNLLAA